MPNIFLGLNLGIYISNHANKVIFYWYSLNIFSCRKLAVLMVN